jgi:hypothetical protein
MSRLTALRAKVSQKSVGKAMEGNNKKADYPDCQAEG